MYDKQTIKTLISRCKSQQSILIPKYISPTDKSRLLENFTKTVKSRLNGREIVLVSIES